MSTNNAGCASVAFRPLAGLTGLVIWSSPIYIWLAWAPSPPAAASEFLAEKVPVCLIATGVWVIQLIGLRTFRRKADRSVLTYLRAFCTAGIALQLVVALSYSAIQAISGVKPQEKVGYWVPYVISAAVIGALLGILPAVIYRQRHAYNSILWLLFGAGNLAALVIALAAPTPVETVGLIIQKQIPNPAAIVSVILMLEAFTIAEVITSSNLVLRSSAALPSVIQAP